ncbi:MAG: putative oxidoreductase C-terminal domain-containing protein [Alphaproteobacteria bacterium]
MHHLSFLNPGHFHAALTLRAANPRVHPTIHVYAPGGPDLAAFLALVGSFDHRAWDLSVHAGPNALQRLIAERTGDRVVLAGRNDAKLSAIAALHQAGFAVLADKPWIVGSADLGYLDRATAGAPLAMDMMVTHHDGLVRLRQCIVATASVFGSFDGSPAITFDSVHHLVKQVNGETLRRPPWYYDVRVQGDGMVDIQSHMVGQVQDLIGPDRAWDFDRDVVIDEARRWTTAVPLALYQDSTGEAEIPPALSEAGPDGVLDLACNGEIKYRILGHEVRQTAIWEPREPVGGGDTTQMIIRGSGAKLVMRQGPETAGKPELHLQPSATDGFDVRVREALPAWRERFPGLDIEASDLGFRLRVPTALTPSHEAQFPLLLDTFLDTVETTPAALTPTIRARYTLLAKAQEMASA